MRLRDLENSRTAGTTSSNVNTSAAMLLPRILAPVRASIQIPSTFILPASRVIDAVRSANGPSAHAPTLSFVRHSAHQAQGRANGAKDGPGKRLGAKKSGGTVNWMKARERGRNADWDTQESMLFRATSSSASAAHIGSLARTANLVVTIAFSPPSPDTSDTTRTLSSIPNASILV